LGFVHQFRKERELTDLLLTTLYSEGMWIKHVWIEVIQTRDYHPVRKIEKNALNPPASCMYALTGTGIHQHGNGVESSPRLVSQRSPRRGRRRRGASSHHPCSLRHSSNGWEEARDAVKPSARVVVGEAAVSTDVSVKPRCCQRRAAGALLAATTTWPFPFRPPHERERADLDLFYDFDLSVDLSVA
jgi:hypothetical protein